MNEVEAVKTKNQLSQIETLLSEKSDIFGDVWSLGINSALRVSDLLSIEMCSLKDLDANNPVLKIKEQKTGKNRSIRLNTVAMAIIQDRLAKYPNDKWLFQSTSGRFSSKAPQPINRRSVARVFHDVGEKTIPRLQLSTHSMRKTRGYFLHANGHSIESISRILNHSSTSITMRYIGLTQQSIDDSFTELVL